jgi:hypothetical protein
MEMPEGPIPCAAATLEKHLPLAADVAIVRPSASSPGAPPAAPRRGEQRWRSAEGGGETVHGVRLDHPWPPQRLQSKPLRRLRRRRLYRRLLVGVVGLALIALAAWGLVWLMDSFQGYNPQHYEPKDRERERHELQQRLDELSRPRQ